MKKRPVLLCILDGWGCGDEQNPDNAIARARTVNYDRFLRDYPAAKLETSGLAVGLPEGQMGNSEVGHATIGAGRVIYQDLVRINKAIESGDLAQNEDLLALVANLQQSGKAVHLMGLLSDGGVHCHQDHMVFLANFLLENGVKVYLHAFLDGRDVAQKSALGFYEDFAAKTGGKVTLATVSGRYYAMDRDKRWDRVKKTYDAIAFAEGGSACGFKELIEGNYKCDVTDEFVKPTVIAGYHGVKEGDAMIFCNFRADRAREISQSFLDDEFGEFATKKGLFSDALAMTQYCEGLSGFYKILFKPIQVRNSLPEILAAQGLKQLRIAETEKYAHVTFFFSCGREELLDGEKRILIDSPDVATYDLRPEMAALEVGEKLRAAIASDEFDFIVVNYANPDMVGHSGVLEASISACQAIDKELGLLEKAILQAGGVMLVTADHGNIECMRDENGNPHTSHTTNLVPLILVSDDAKKELQDGTLADIAPTVLDLMGLDKGEGMTGGSLL